MIYGNMAKVILCQQCFINKETTKLGRSAWCDNCHLELASLAGTDGSTPALWKREEFNREQ